ncbi:ABC transporter [Acetivibrio straminisolvens JCM 21531]|jgi:ATP-binding cassette subfamily B protein|uniref:ABC transporter n=2 Tax=Acetivibrio straminisolvens TaxID=253314 RepID=W4V9C8_9FIRM|nr:ABC transporter [Acetivibrio straminisolvens JCM 21531]
MGNNIDKVSNKEIFRCYVIAHGLSAVRNADRLILLEHGEIIEQGTNEELLTTCGRYYQLYTWAVESN